MSIWSWIGKQTDLNESRTRDALVELCRDAGPVSTFLDCGCSDGDLTIRMARAVKAETAIGIDVVPKQVDKAREKGIDARVGNVDKGLDIPDNSLDMVTASHIIEHVADTDGLLKEFHRILRPGGRLVMATPNLAALPNILLLVAGKQPTIAEVSDVALVGTWSPRKTAVDRTGPAHRRLFTRGALKGLLQYYGFQCEKMGGVGFLPLPPVLGKMAATVLPVYSWNTVVRARKL